MPIINKTKNTAAIFNRGREVVKVYDHGKLAWQKSTSIPDYLCFTALEAGTFTLTVPAAVTATYLSYVEWSKDGRTWNHRDNSSDIETIDVQVAQGEKVYWRGSGVCMNDSTHAQINYCSVFTQTENTPNFVASGNLVSLIALSDFDYEVRKACAFANLFFGNEKLTDAETLILPMFGAGATYLFYMTFKNCSNLAKAPILNLTRTTNNCCFEMFRGTALTTMPELPNVALSNYCYSGMFRETNIEEAVLPSSATTLVTSCYSNIFYGCTHLKYVKCLATDISATNCLTSWLSSVSATGTFIQAEGVTWPRGASGIPTGWVDIEKRTMPNGYKQLLQVTSDGTAYIQLGFGFEDTDEVAATFSVDNTQSNDKYIVSSQTWNSNNNRYGLGQHLANHYYTPAFGGLSTGQTCLTPLTANNGELHNWTYASRLFTLVDLSLSKDVSSITFGGVTTNLRLFYGMAPNNTKGAISSYKHIKGSTTACDFVAAIRESDDTAGLYDLANNEFMTCNGLTAGEEI